MRLRSLPKSPASSTDAISSRVPSATLSALRDTVALMGATMPYARNVEIFGEGEPAEYLYEVVRGAVRTYKLTSDGRRQIGAFYLPGDIFGMEASPTHRLTAEAVSDSSIRVLKQNSVTARAARDANVARELWTMTANELERVQNLALTLGRKTAEERVAGFLLAMAARNPDDKVVELPMSRQDIADHLGLTIETVSRTIAQLEDASMIDVPSTRRIVLRDKRAIAQISG